MKTQSGGAQAELHFLQHLLVGFQEPSSSTHFNLILFDDEETTATSTGTSTKYFNILEVIYNISIVSGLETTRLSK